MDGNENGEEVEYNENGNQNADDEEVDYNMKEIFNKNQEEMPEQGNEVNYEELFGDNIDEYLEE